MSQEVRVHWSWLKGMYIYTIIGAGAFGLGILIAPELIRQSFGWPPQDRISFGINGSVYLAFALISILGLRSPLKIAPLLLLQLGYKVIWFIAVIIPVVLTGKFTLYAAIYATIYATYIIGDIIAIPFPYVFATGERQQVFEKLISTKGK